MRGSCLQLHVHWHMSPAQMCKLSQRVETGRQITKTFVLRTSIVGLSTINDLIIRHRSAQVGALPYLHPAEEECSALEVLSQIRFISSMTRPLQDKLRL